MIWFAAVLTVLLLAAVALTRFIGGDIGRGEVDDPDP